MSHCKNAAQKSNNAGRDYFKKRGFLKRCWGHWMPVSNRPGVNKITKRLTNKSERQQVRDFIKRQKDIDPEYADIVSKNFWDLV